MFKNLSTSRKLFILCSMFVIALGVTTYSLVTEKLIAIEFARKELAGNRYLDTIRGIYQAVLIGRSGPGGTASSELSSESLLAALAAAEAETDGRFQTAALEQTLAAKLEALWSSDAPRGGSDDPIVDAVAAARDLAQRIGDDSNLTLDPDLDTYYVQNIIVKALPTLLGQLGELAMLTPEVTAAAARQDSHTRLLVLDGLLRASTEAIGDDLASAYRGNADGRLKPAVDPSFAALIAATNSYADASAAGPAGASASLSGTYASAVERAMSAWIVAGRELDRLLGQRIDELVLRLETSLLVTAVLGGLSILIAVLTHRHIVKPLERFESVARTIREMKIYSLRVDEGSSDEIGRLAASFNAMLAELADAREREITEQSELARVTRSTAMGAMTASIAHEINQPLAAIVTNSNAALRWLGNATPNVEEARAALKRISADGHRAGEIISGIRAMFKRDASHRVAIDTNELIREVLLLANTTLQAQRAMVETDLREGLAEVLGDRVQLQQVFLNLIINAAESMGSVTDRARFLLVRSDVDDHGGVLVAVADSGTGIAQQDLNRVFEAFFTTKASGMGMGLFICRSIIESHGGRLWAAPRFPHGTVFYVALPPETAVEE